jgi:hypothetical protein
MPQAVAVFVADFFIAFGETYLAANIAYYFTYVATVYLIGRAVNSLAPKHPRGLGRSLDANYASTDAGVPMVLGEARVGGLECIPPITSGNNGEYLHRVIAVAGHQCQSFQTAYFDDTATALSDFGSVSGSDSDGVAGSGAGKFQNHVWLRTYLGTTTQNVDFILNAMSPTAFPSTFRGRGITYAALRYKWDQDIYTSIPSQTFVVRGAICYDPRLDISPGFSPTNPSYAAWTQNPALILAWYLTETIVGGSYDPSEIDWTLVVTAANTCDATVNVPTASTAPRYTTNGLLIASNNFIDNVKIIVDSMLGRIIFRDGQWRMHAGQWRTPTFDISKSDWCSPLSITFEGGREKRFARARCWYVDASRNWQRVECQPRANAAYYATDGNEWNDTEFEQPLCNNEYEAQRKTEMLLRQSRNQVIIAGQLPPRFQDIALWDTGAISDPDLGWVDKTFRCVGIDLAPNGSINAVFQEEQSGDWTDLTEAEYNAPSTHALPSINPTTPTEPATFTVTPNINGTLGFVIGDPVVEPRNTRFQVIRTLTSTNAAVGTVIYDGVMQRIDLASPTSQHYFFARAYAGSYFSPYKPNTLGLNATAGQIDTGQITNGAAAFVSMANCSVYAVFSGAGAIHTSQMGHVDFASMSMDADVSVTATFRAGMGNITGTNQVQLRFVTGVSSVYTSPSNINPYPGFSQNSLQTYTMIGKFSYTRNNSSYVELTWNTSSGPNSIGFDDVAIRTEFIRA